MCSMKRKLIPGPDLDTLIGTLQREHLVEDLGCC